MKKGILLIAVILMSTAGLVQAQGDDLDVTLDVTWVSKYLWRGIDRLDDKAALQPSVNIDLFDTGFSVKLWTSYAGSSKGDGSISTVNATEYRYVVAYNCTLFEGERYVTDVEAQYIYYDFIDEPSKAKDAQEIGAGFSWPELCPQGFVPSYYVGRIWQSRSNTSLAKNYGGWLHVFGLGYDLTVPAILPDTAEQVLSLSVEATYNDGFAGADNDWSHIVWGIATSMEIGPGTCTPGIYYQNSMEDTVNTEDELWASVSYKINF